MARWFVDRHASAGDSLGELEAAASRGPVRGLPRLGGLRLHRRSPPPRPGAGVRRDPRPALRRARLRPRGPRPGRGGRGGGTPLPGGGPAPGGRRRRAVGPCADLPGPRRRSLAAARGPGRDRDVRQDGRPACSIRSILEAAGRRCGLIGALGWSDGTTTRGRGGRGVARRGRGAGVDPGLHGRSGLRRGGDRGVRARPSRPAASKGSSSRPRW